MGSIKTNFDRAFRDYSTDGVRASGRHEPIKSDIRAIAAIIEAEIAAAALTGVNLTAAAALIYPLLLSAQASQAAAEDAIELANDAIDEAQALSGDFADVVAAAGYNVVDEVRAAATGNITVSNPGTATFDGIVLSNGDRLLLGRQTSAPQNGLYTFNGSGSALTRVADFDQTAEVKKGSLVVVMEGLQMRGSWAMVSADPITVGTTDQVWRRFHYNDLTRSDLKSTASGKGAELMKWRQNDAGAVDMTVLDELRNRVSVKQFGAVGDGIADDSAAITATVLFAKVVSQTVGGWKSLMPTIYFPRGKYRITQVGALTSPFASGGIYQGISYVGEGRGQTRLIYSSTSNASNNYLANFETCSFVSVSDMTIESTDSDLRCFLWGPNGGGSGNGSGWHCKSVVFEGPWTAVFTVQGTALGSETYWQNVLGSAGFASGVFFQILSSNPQSVNHTFVHCTIGGLGTTFKLRAGGNIRIYGGYCSLFEGATFMDLDAIGSLIGAGNGEIVIHGMNFETAFGIVSACVLRHDSSATIHFQSCTFFSVAPSGSDPVFIVGSSGNQRGGRLIFDGCHYPGKKSVFTNGISVDYRECVGVPQWQTFMTIARGSSSARLAPNIRIKGTLVEGAAPVDPVDCYPKLFVNDYIAHPEAAVMFSAMEPLHWSARAGTETNHPGLVIGLGSTYAYFAFKVPLNSIVRRVRLWFTGNNPTSTAQRKFKIENYTGTVLLPEVTIASPATSYPYAYESNFIGSYFADTEAKREIRIYGQANYGAAPTADVDWGWAEVEYS